MGYWTRSPRWSGCELQNNTINNMIGATINRDRMVDRCAITLTHSAATGGASPFSAIRRGARLCLRCSPRPKPTGSSLPRSRAPGRRTSRRQPKLPSFYHSDHSGRTRPPPAHDFEPEFVRRRITRRSWRRTSRSLPLSAAVPWSATHAARASARFRRPCWGSPRPARTARPGSSDGFRRGCRRRQPAAWTMRESCTSTASW